MLYLVKNTSQDQKMLILLEMLIRFSQKPGVFFGLVILPENNFDRLDSDFYREISHKLINVC